MKKVVLPIQMMALFKVVLALQNANKKLVEIALQMLAEGFSYQKGAIFGFGPSANLGTEITMMQKPWINLYRCIKFWKKEKGETNYELKIKAKENLHNVSRKSSKIVTI